MWPEGSAFAVHHPWVWNQTWQCIFLKKELENPSQDECDHFFLMANQGPEQNESTLFLVVKTHHSLIRLLEETTDGNRLTCPASKVKNALFL